MNVEELIAKYMRQTRNPIEHDEVKLRNAHKQTLLKFNRRSHRAPVADVRKDPKKAEGSKPDEGVDSGVTTAARHQKNESGQWLTT